jgi:hypothetical protein
MTMRTLDKVCVAFKPTASQALTEISSLDHATVPSVAPSVVPTRTGFTAAASQAPTKVRRDDPYGDHPATAANVPANQAASLPTAPGGTVLADGKAGSARTPGLVVHEVP